VLTHVGGARQSRQGGFTFLELLVVIAILSVLLIVALGHYRKLMVTVESSKVQHDLGVMRSAVSMQVADHYVAGKMPELIKLVNSNPMDLLTEQSPNYIGQSRLAEQAKDAVGNWFFDVEQHELVYLVRNIDFFIGGDFGPRRARFKIFPVYADKVGKEQKPVLTGLKLKAVKEYGWQKH